MRAPRLPHRTAPMGVAMTPMIDVVFLLLVFFLITASFQEPEGDLAARLVVEGASGAGAAGLEAPPTDLDDVLIRVAVQRGATSFVVGERSVADSRALAALLTELAGIDAAIPVTIDADGRAPMSDVVAAYDAARLAGFADVRLAADAAAPSGAVSGPAP